MVLSNWLKRVLTSRSSRRLKRGSRRHMATKAFLSQMPRTEELEARTLLTAFAINSVMLAEGDAGGTTFTFTVTRTNDLVPSVTDEVLSYTTANGTATSASGDYTAIAGSLTFAGGAVPMSVDSQTILVTVNGDAVIEDNETFSVNLAENVFHCHDAACGKHGDVIDLWAALHQISLRDAALDLVQTFHLEPAPQPAKSEKRHG